MAGQRLSSTFAALSMLVTSLLMVSGGYAYPADENILEDAEPIAYPLSAANNFQEEDESPRFTQIEKPKSCFHFYVSRNMSSLLSDATKMLQQVRDRREREWILTFIYRIKSLAEHLRTHPESRNYHCLPSEDDNDSRRRSSPLSDSLRIPQPELYFIDDMLPNQKRGGNADGPPRDSAEEMGPDIQSDDTKPNPQANADNQIPGAWSEQSMYGVSPEKGTAQIKTETSSPTANQPGRKHIEEEGKPVNSFRTTLAATSQSELRQPEEDLHIETAASNQASPPTQSTDGAQNAAPSPDGNRHSPDEGIVLSSPADCDSRLICKKVYRVHTVTDSDNGQYDDGLVQQLHMPPEEIDEEEDRMQQSVLKQRIRKALLEDMAPEVKKLRTVGGTEDDLINLWKLSEAEEGNVTPDVFRHEDDDFDYQENGAAAGDLIQSVPLKNHVVVAPSIGEMKNFKRQTDSGKYDGDVLVQQLFDVRFEPAKTTKSLSDQQEEYSITSTHNP